MKPTKKQLKQLRQIANTMPATYQKTDVYRAVLGEQIGRVPGKTYVSKVFEDRPVNHYKRILRMFHRGVNIEDIKSYVLSVIQAHEESVSRTISPPVVGGIKMKNYGI